MFEDGYLCVPDLGAEGGFYLRSGGVSPGMQDAGHAVGGFARKRDLAVQRVERDPEFHQVGDAVGSFVGQDADGLLVAEPGPGGDRVLVMEFWGVFDADGGRDASLGMTRIAVIDPALGYEQDGAVFFGEKRAVKPCDAAADYYIVVLFNIRSSVGVGLFYRFVLFLSDRHAREAYRRTGFDAEHYRFFVQGHNFAVDAGPCDDLVAGFQVGCQFRLVLLAFLLRTDEKKIENYDHEGQESPGQCGTAVHIASCIPVCRDIS
jgi:hypothetical protein